MELLKYPSLYVLNSIKFSLMFLFLVSFMFCFFVLFCCFFFVGGRGHVKYLRTLREPGKNSGEEKDSFILHALSIKSQRHYLIKINIDCPS